MLFGATNHTQESHTILKKQDLKKHHKSTEQKVTRWHSYQDLNYVVKAYKHFHKILQDLS